MIKGLKLDANRLQACDPLMAQVLWFSKPDAGERTLLAERFHLDEHAVASARTRMKFPASSFIPMRCF